MAKGVGKRGKEAKKDFNEPDIFKRGILWYNSQKYERKRIGVSI